jgi:hypothetical protein
MTAVDYTRPEALLTSGSGCRWLLHEGEWATPFRSAQWRTRCPGRAERRQTEAVAESGGQSEQGGMKAVEAERKNPRPSAPFIATRGGGGRQRGGGKRGGATVWTLTHDLGADVRTGRLTGGPTWFVFFLEFPKPLQLVKSKQMPYIAPNISKFCVVLDWSILHKFCNCSYLKFPTESMLQIMEQIQI